MRLNAFFNLIYGMFFCFCFFCCFCCCWFRIFGVVDMMTKKLNEREWLSTRHVTYDPEFLSNNRQIDGSKLSDGDINLHFLAPVIGGDEPGTYDEGVAIAARAAVVWAREKLDELELGEPFPVPTVGDEDITPDGTAASEQDVLIAKKAIMWAHIQSEIRTKVHKQLTLPKNMESWSGEIFQAIVKEWEQIGAST
jgi:hypothetical protein